MPLKPILSDSSSRMTALVIGRSGIGKTSLLRTLPEGERVCTISAEAGLLCVRDLVESGQIEGFEITSLGDFRDAYIWLANDPAPRERYKWVFIDSLTEISGRCVEYYKAKYPDRSDSFPMWGAYSDEMTKLVKDFRDLAYYNIVFTALEEIDKDSDNLLYYAPAVDGKRLKERLTSYFDEVFYFTTVLDANGQPQRVLFTQPFDRRPGKDRSGRLAPMEYPHLSYIKQKIMNGGN